LSSGGLHPQASYRGFAFDMDPSGDLRLPDPLTSRHPQLKNMNTSLSLTGG